MKRMFYHVTRVREAGLGIDNPVIAYLGCFLNAEEAERVADMAGYVGGTYVDVFETDARTFPTDWLAA